MWVKLVRRGEQILAWFKLMSLRQMTCGDVYTVLHFGTVSNGTESNDVIELLDDDEDLCSTEVIQY